MQHRTRIVIQAGIAVVVLTGSLLGQQAPVGYDDTPKQPSGRWRIHDGTRPQPRAVAPGNTAEMSPAPAPQDAIVLVGKGDDRSAWQMTDGAPVTWPMSNGVLEAGKGFIQTKAQFTDVQLHVEFATPREVKGDSQGRGNSGVFLNGVFEIQVLDSYENKSYADGQASAMYGQYPPLVNASRPPGEWQSYDIFFSAPTFKDGKVDKPAVVTVLHNGVLVQDHATFVPKKTCDDSPGPLRIQDHYHPDVKATPVRLRNVWLRPLPAPPAAPVR